MSVKSKKQSEKLHELEKEGKITFEYLKKLHQGIDVNNLPDKHETFGTLKDIKIRKPLAPKKMRK